MDLTALTDADFEDHRLAVEAERVRREELRSLPAMIEELSARYFRASGNGKPPIDAATRGVNPPKGGPAKPPTA